MEDSLFKRALGHDYGEVKVVVKGGGKAGGAKHVEKTREIEPRFCDVAVSRWEQLTGLKGERLNGNTR